MHYLLFGALPINTGKCGICPFWSCGFHHWSSFCINSNSEWLLSVSKLKMGFLVSIDKMTPQMSTIGAQSQSPSTTDSGSFMTQFKQHNRPVTFNPGDIISFVNTNPRALQILGLAGGGALCAVGVMSFLNAFSILTNPLGYTLNLYYLLFGLCIVWTSLLGDNFISQKIYSEFNFLSNARGRGLFFVFIASLLISSTTGGHVNWLYLVVGVYFLLLGVASLVVAWQASRG